MNYPIQRTETDIFTVEPTGRTTQARVPARTGPWTDVPECAFKRNGTTLTTGTERSCEHQREAYERALVADPGYNPLRGINGVFG